MNKLLCFFFLMAAILVAAHGQCRNDPDRHSCSQPRRLGNLGSNCHSVTRWWYDKSSRSCKEFKYRGCGGNSNRYCSKSACQNHCM
ncbi:kunitz-like toxin PcKuz3 [Stomoxys calcitrans]|uniref:kunitz-like toxin PcKuz3 n=1 Tax=Stomoxys calcitrans TaxID=35570 RepID=UPI0027E361F6|nr:kunitz-like toxin PcKuz3 [Stomoxys calcitrans]